MKFLLQILMVLLLIVGLYFLLGYIVKEQRNTNEVHVKAPIELCWDIYHNEDRISEWMESIKSIKEIKGSKGMVGSEQKIVMKGGEDISGLAEASQLVRTITKTKRPSSFSYDYTNSIMDGSAEISFSISDSTTIIKSEDVFSAKKLWVRSALFFMKSSINKRTQSQFEKLKTIIENEYLIQLSQDTLIKESIESDFF